MSEMQGKQRSAVVFGARNLGRAVIELLVSDGWAVTGAARSRSTLDGVSAAGAKVQNAVAPSPEKNEQLRPQAPRGSHHGTN